MPAQSLPNVLAEMKSQDEPNLIFFNHHLAWIKFQLPTVTYCDFFVVCRVCMVGVNLVKRMALVNVTSESEQRSYRSVNLSVNRRSCLLECEVLFSSFSLVSLVG